MLYLDQARGFLRLASLDHYTDFGPFGWDAFLGNVPQEPALFPHLHDKLPDAGVLVQFCPLHLDDIFFPDLFL